MSKIYFDKHDKQELINNIMYHNNTTKTSIIKLIKKYHKYETFLNFLPSVLTNIVFEYVNDVIELEYIITYTHNNMYFYEFNAIANINYVPIDIDINFVLTNSKKRNPSIHIEYLDGWKPYAYSKINFYSYINWYMDMYYKKKSYIDYVNYGQHSTRIPPNIDDVYKYIKIKNHRQMTHNIVIFKKIIDCILKIKL